MELFQISLKLRIFEERISFILSYEGILHSIHQLLSNSCEGVYRMEQNCDKCVPCREGVYRIPLLTITIPVAIWQSSPFLWLSPHSQN